MNDMLRPIYEEITGREDTLGVLILEKTKMNSPLTEQFDIMVIILKKNSETQATPYDIEHYEVKDKKVVVYIIEEKKFLEWLSEGNHRRYLLWVLNGRVLFDRDEYITKLRRRLREFPIDIRKKKIAIEFSKMIRCCSNGKELYEIEQYLDAYNQMVKALHHLARLAVIEHGFYPEVTVWNQVKKIEPEVYTLYMELVESNELLVKRVQLLLLALEFAASSRARIGSSYLIEVMKSKKGAWTISELVKEKKLKELTIDLGLLLQYLEAKNIIEIEKCESEAKSTNQRKYKVR